jgi:carboxyvinyl-carboxyphosphonate phosphorylmutase
VTHEEDDMGRLLRKRPQGATHFRALIEQGTTVLAPGAYDPLSARLVEAAGFPAVYMTGFGTAASMLGRPDVGLLTMSEMVDNARRIVQAVDVPVVADADTGYGNAVNVVRTVREYEAAGVAAIHIEDQLMPKRCGHMAGKLVTPADEMTAKIEAAVAARTDPDFLVIARTDARAVEGFDSALARARKYRDAGADMLFVEAPESLAEVEGVAAAFPDVPLLFNWIERGRTPAVDLETLTALGYRLVIFPLTSLFAATGAVSGALAAVAAKGTPLPVAGEAPGFEEFLDVIGLPEIQQLERRFLPRS